MSVQTVAAVHVKRAKKTITLPLRIYQKLLDRIEDLEDALDLKKAKKSAKSFVDFDQLAKQYKA